jgi:hypothetical protein
MGAVAAAADVSTGGRGGSREADREPGAPGAAQPSAAGGAVEMDGGRERGVV